MEDSIYVEGITLSRKFKNRNDESTEKLYSIIKKAIILIQAGTDAERDEATIFMLRLFRPHVRRVATKIYRSVKGIVEFEDVLQETYTLFLSLLNRYNSSISAFSYFIGVMLPQHMNRWAEKEITQGSLNVFTDMGEYVIVDPLLGSRDNVDTYLNLYVFNNEYEKFILERAERQSRSSTVKVVCNKFFLGGSSCSEIARSLGISYHAVYEIIGKIRDELKEHLLNSAFSDMMEDVDAGIPKKSTRGRRSY